MYVIYKNIQQLTMYAKNYVNCDTWPKILVKTIIT